MKLDVHTKIDDSYYHPKDQQDCQFAEEIVVV
jgi:hypothetical protein